MERVKFLPPQFLRGFVIFLGVAAINLVLVSSAWAFKFDIDPPRVELSIAAGRQKTAYITVTNSESTAPLHVKAYAQDLIYLPDGSNDFLPPGTTPWSCAKWIRIKPVEFDLPPGRSQTVRFTISVPKGIKGGRYGVIFFETTQPPAPGESGVAVNIRLGTIVLLEVPKTAVYKARLTTLTISEPGVGKPLEIYVTVRNEGNVLIRPIGTVKILDGEREVAEVNLNPAKRGILPQTNHKFILKYEGHLAEGRYSARAIFDYGGDVLLAGEIPFNVPGVE